MPSPSATSRFRRVMMALLLCGGLGGAVWWWTGTAAAPVSSGIAVSPTLGEFVAEVVDRGEIESSSNVELRCEVAVAEGVRIVEIVAEGTLVKAGDVVVQLDDSNLKKEVNNQQVLVNTTEAAMSKAKNDYSAAETEYKEYDEGVYLQEEQKTEGEVFVAEENARRAENYLEFSKKLESRGYISEKQTESDVFAVEKAQKDLDAARTRLRVLRDFTRPKKLREFESKIRTAQALVAAETAKYEVELEKLKRLQGQLENCVIKAPQDGQLVYANVERWRGDEYMIRRGNVVRERQIIAKLPDPSRMQVSARVAESRVNRVKPGMPVTITLEALRGLQLKGEVKSVSAYASDQNWFNPNVKEYESTITILDPPQELKPGMSASVSIRVEQLAEVLQTPIQAVVERGGKHYCVVRDAQGKLSAREVLVGSTNDKHIVIKDGLTVSDEVLMNPRVHLKQVGLGDVEPGQKSDGKAGPAVAVR